MMNKGQKEDFWTNIDFLLAIEHRRSDKDLKEEVDDWADKFIAKRSSKVDDSYNDVLVSPILNNGRENYRRSSKLDAEIKRFIKGLKLQPIECKFSHPQIRSKLEKLMGSNLVSLTDREYMIYLQERILLDYSCCMNKRIAMRQAEEMERVKGLVLSGKIPLSNAPPEMANHPVMLIDEYCKQVLAERRAKIKILRANISKYLYWDDTPDPPSGLSIELGHVLRKTNDRLCMPPDVLLCAEDSENLADGYMFTDEDYDMVKYESPLIKELRECETVTEMYELADEIIGTLKTIDDHEYY